MAGKNKLSNAAVAVGQGGDDVAKILGAVVSLLGAANEARKAAQPVIDELAAAIPPDAPDAIAKAGANAAGAVAGAFGKAGDAIGGLFAKAGGAANDVLKDLASARNEKEIHGAIVKARQAVLENATQRVLAADLVKAGARDDASIAGPISAMPGCYVIATYEKLDFDKDLTDYRGIFIGKSENVAEALRREIRGDGNPDVYADVKYRQNVQVYVYYCLPEDLDERYQALCQTFNSERSKRFYRR